MAAKQTNAEIEMRRNRESRQHICMVWDARKEVTVPSARKVGVTESTSAFVGVDWMADYKAKAKGEPVIM